MNKFTIYGWADMYWEVQNEFSFPVRSGDDFLTGFLYSKKGVVTLELKARRKTIVELFNNNSIYNLQKNIKYFYYEKNDSIKMEIYSTKTRQSYR